MTYPMPYRAVDPFTREPVNIRAGAVMNPRTGRVSESAGSSGMLWNDRGEMQASDKRDAFRQIARVTDQRATGGLPHVFEFDRTAATEPTPWYRANSRGERIWTPPTRYGMGNIPAGFAPTAMTAERGFAPSIADHGQIQVAAQMRTQQLIDQLHDPVGVRIVGQQMVNPVRELLDFEGIARRILPVRPVKQGETVRYDKDPYVVAYTMGRDATVPESRVHVSFVFPTPQEIAELLTIELRDLYTVGYDVMARAMDRGRQAMEFREDKVLIGFLEQAVQSRKKIVYFTQLNLAAIEAIRFQVERDRIPADKLLINRQELQDIVSVVSSEVDPISQRELTMAGYLGNILNMPILTSAGPDGKFEVVPAGSVYCVTAPPFLGGLPIWHDLASEPITQFNMGKLVRGWLWYLFEAMVLINNRGVAKGVKAS